MRSQGPKEAYGGSKEEKERERGPQRGPRGLQLDGRVDSGQDVRTRAIHSRFRRARFHQKAARAVTKLEAGPAQGKSQRGPPGIVDLEGTRDQPHSYYKRKRACIYYYKVNGVRFRFTQSYEPNFLASQALKMEKKRYTLSSTAI